MSYSAGQAILTIVPSFQGVADAIDGEAAKWGVSAGDAFAQSFSRIVEEETKGAIGDQDADAGEKGDSAGGTFADSFKLHVDAALHSLPDVEIDGNSTDVDIKIAAVRAALEGLSSMAIGIDITDDEALAKLAVLKAVLAEIGASSESIQVKVDTGAALGELAAVGAAAGDGPGGAGAGLGQLGGDAEAAGGSISTMVPALALLATGLIPLAGLAAGGLATLPSILAGIGSGGAALALGFSGLPGAISAYNATLNTVGQTAAQVKSNQDALANSLAGLTPAGRAFVGFVGSELMPAFDQLKSSVQAAILPGVTAGLEAMEPVFRVIGGFITQAASGIGSFVSGMGSFLGSEQGVAGITTIFQAGAGFMGDMAAAANNLFPALLQGASSASPLVADLGGGIESLVNSFSKWLSGNGFQGFLEWITKNGPGLVGDVQKLASGAGQLLVSLAPLGVVVDKVVGYFGDLLGGISDLVGWFSTGKHLLDLLSIATDALVGPFVQVGLAIAGFVTNWKQALSDVVGFFKALPGHIVNALGDFLGAIMIGLIGIGQWVNDNVGVPVIAFFTALPGHIVNALGDFLGAIMIGLIGVGEWMNDNVGVPVISFFTALPGNIVTALGDFLNTIFNGLKAAGTWVDINVISPVVGFFTALPGDIVGALGDIVSTIWSGLTTAASWINTNVITPVVTFFGGLGTAISGAVSNVTGFLTAPFSAAISIIAGIASTIVGIINSIIGAYNAIPFLPNIPTIPTGGGVPKGSIGGGAAVGASGSHALVASSPNLPNVASLGSSLLSNVSSSSVSSSPIVNINISGNVDQRAIDQISRVFNGLSDQRDTAALLELRAS